MNAVFLLIIVICLTVQNVCNKEYNRRVGIGTFTFAAVGSLFALTVFIVTGGGKFTLSTEYLGYSIAFAIAYSTTVITAYYAICTGPLSLSALISSYSLVIPALYGIIILNEPGGAPLIIGIALLLISLVLINLEDKKEEKKLSLKWAIFAALSFVCNGACSVIQKVQQISCGGRYKSEFMICALFITVSVLMIAALITERKQILPSIKKGTLWSALRGLSNGAVNLLVLVLSLKMAASVMFPVISAGGIVATVFISIFFYKEKMSKKQLLGLILGVGAIILLNI